jgi:Spy/CpxP family protein refolding chaperone
MKTRLLAVVCSLLGFVAGAVACFLALRAGRLPPPPVTLFTEFRDILRLHPLPDSPADRAAIFRQTMQLWPRIEQYREDMAAIDAEFRNRIAAALSPGQQASFAQLIAERRRQMDDFRQLAQSPAAVASGAPADGSSLREGLLLEPLIGVASIVQVGTVLELLTARLQLTPERQAQVRALLIERRTRFLEFMDKNPPPSMGLGTIFKQTEKGANNRSADR